MGLKKTERKRIDLRNRKVTRVLDDYFMLKGGRRFHNPFLERYSCMEMEVILFWCPEMLSEENEVSYEKPDKESCDQCSTIEE